MPFAPNPLGLFYLAVIFSSLGLFVACTDQADTGAARSAQSGQAGMIGSSEATPVFTGTVNQIEVNLYFLRADGKGLTAERRGVFKTSTVNDRVRQAVQALLDGPEGNSLPALPPGTQLREIFVASDGTAYVDLGPEMLLGISLGTSDAVFAIYSVVNTLVENFDEISQVKILIEGKEAENVGGHFDLSRPMLPEMSLVTGRRRR
jgi:hypothetical protein